MPRFRAAVLDRAAAAGAPRLRSDFHGVSEWHSYQDSWLKVFWPDETLAVDNLVERQTTWAAATRQHTKAETQRLADALRAAGSATGNAAGMAAVGSSSTAACDGGPLPLAHGELSGLAAGMGSKHYEEGSAAGPSAHSGVQHGSAGSLRASDTTMVVSGSDRVLGYSVTQHSSADILDTLHELLRDRPSLSSEFHARLAGRICHQVSSSRSLQPPLTPEGCPPLFMQGSAAVAAPMPKLHDEEVFERVIRELRAGELSSNLQQLVRRACAPSGADCGRYDDVHGHRVLSCLYLNAHGTQPEHLAGSCWRSPQMSEPYRRLLQGDEDYGDPSFGEKVAMMKSGYSDTLLVRAARNGRVQTMKLLIEMDADVNQQSGYGESPLFAACLESQLDAVRLLFESAAHLSFVHDMTGYTMLNVAVLDFHDREREEARSWASLCDALPSGAGAWIKVHHESLWAKTRARLAVVKYLLNTCDIAPLEMQLCAEGPERNSLFTLLHHYDECYLGDLYHLAEPREIVQQLMQHGFNPNIQVKCPSYLCQWTPRPPECTLLHIACLQARHCRGHFDSSYQMVDLLLKGKGDPTIFNSHGESPIEFAQRRNVKALLKLLQHHAPTAPLYKPWEPLALPPPSRVVSGGISFSPRAVPETSGPSSAMVLMSQAVAESPGPSLALVPSSPASTDASRVALPDVQPSEERVERKRIRHATPMLYRAERLGVADQLRAFPETPADDASSEELQAFKRAKRATEKANQQVVAREEKRLRPSAHVRMMR